LSSIGGLYTVAARWPPTMKTPGSRPPRGAVHRASRPPAALAALALAAVAVGCTHRARARLEETRPAAVLVEVLPRSAEVRVDGRVVGRGGGMVPASRADEGSHRVAFLADGYVPEEQEFPEGGLAGVRVGAALRPEGFGGPPLDLEDAGALAEAAAFLLSAGSPRDAADYAERAASLAPGLAAPHRVLGDARRAVGDAAGAIAAWSEYLKVAPRAPDADAVVRRIEATRAGAAAPAR
jgi:tetratricopeptide (TPR) repeat protein